MDSSQALDDDTRRPVATPSRAALPPVEEPKSPPVPQVSGQLTLEELGACQFKPYPNQPNLPPRLPSKDSMRQLTCWDLPKFLNGAKVDSPGSTVATTVLECTPTSPPASTHEAFQRLSKPSVSKHMHFLYIVFQALNQDVYPDEPQIQIQFILTCCKTIFLYSLELGKFIRRYNP